MTRKVINELVTRWGFDVDDSELIKLQNRERELRGQFAKLGAVAAAAFAAVVVPAAKFDRALRQTLTLTDETGAAFTRMSETLQKQALDLSEELGFSGTEVARSFYDVLSTGAKAGSKEFTDLATAALKMGKTVGLAPADAVKSLSITVNAFAKANLTAAKAADVFFVASKLAQTSVPELAEAMKQAGPVSAQFGADLGTTTAILATFAQGGFLGVQAGTAFRSGLLRLGKPTKEITTTLRDLGVSLTDDSGNIRNLVVFVKDLQKSMEGMGEAQKAAAITAIFGQRAFAPFASLIDSNLDTLSAWENQLNDANGAVDRGFNIIMGAATEKANQLWISLKNLAAVVGAPLLQPLSEFFDLIRGGVRAARDWLQENPAMLQSITTIGGLVLAVVALGAGIGILTSTIKIAIAGMKLLGAATLVAQLKMLLLPFAIAAVAIGIALLIEDFMAFARGGESFIGQIITIMKELADEMGIVGQIINGIFIATPLLLGAVLGPLGVIAGVIVSLMFLTAVLMSQWDLFKLTLGFLRDDVLDMIGDMDKAIMDFVDNPVKKLKEFFDDIREGIGDLGFALRVELAEATGTDVLPRNAIIDTIARAISVLPPGAGIVNAARAAGVLDPAGAGAFDAGRSAVADAAIAGGGSVQIGDTNIEQTIVVPPGSNTTEVGDAVGNATRDAVRSENRTNARRLSR